MKVTCDFSVTSARHRPVVPSTPWYTPWNSPTSNTAPNLVLDFVGGTYGTSGALGALGAHISVARSSDGSRVDPAGALEILGLDLARLDHDPVTLGARGLLLEAARTNLFLQSDVPASQTITVAAVPHVLSFYGTGTVDLSGAFTSSQTGSGVYPARTVLSFTPTAGALTLTLTGAISSPQLEQASIVSSYIPTSASTATRADDIATKALGSWFDTAQGTLVFEGSIANAQANDRILEIDGGATSTRLTVLWNTVLGKPQFQVWEAGLLQAAIAPSGNSIPLDSNFRVAIAYSANDFAVALNGGGLATDTTGAVSTGLTTLRIGRSVWGAQGLMHVKNLTYFPIRLSDTELQALSA